jgi:DNA-binding Lrp family transcriptional regulator
MKIDKKDFLILGELDINCRISYNKISKKLNLSKDLVNYRIRNLEKNKIIKSYYAVIDYSKLGFYTFKLFANFKRLNEKMVEKISNFFKDNSRVSFLAISNSERLNLAINYNVRDIWEYELFFKKFIYEFSKDIDRKQIGLVDSIEHYSFPLSNNKKFLYVSGLKRDEFELNENETAVLKLLSLNGKMSYVEIAKKSKLNVSQVSYIIKNLEKRKIILGYRCEIDFSKLGYLHFKVYLFLEKFNEEIENKLSRYIFNIENSIYLSRVSNEQDLEFEILAKNHLELNGILEKLKENFPMIRSLEIKSGISIPKMNFNPY